MMTGDAVIWRNLEKFNLALTGGYPSGSSDAKGLCKDQIVEFPTPRGGVMCIKERKTFAKSKVTYWHKERGKKIAGPNLLYEQPGSRI